MKNTFLGLGVVLIVFSLLPFVTQAQVVPQASDIVLVYEHAEVDQQAQYNFIYTVDGDPTVYACEANRCAMEAFQDKGTISLTLYKLPEGFPRPQSIPNQQKLLEFVAMAEQSYRLENVQVNLQTSGSERPYYVADLSASGEVVLTQESYTKPVLEDEQAVSNAAMPVWIWVLVGVGGVAILGAIAILVRNRMHYRNIQL